MYKELKGINLIIYYSNYNNKWYITDISDKTELDEEGNLWCEKEYENCLIALNQRKTTDKLYLYDAEAMKKVYHEVYCDILPDWDFIKRHATKIIERQ